MQMADINTSLVFVNNCSWPSVWPIFKGGNPPSKTMVYDCGFTSIKNRLKMRRKKSDTRSLHPAVSKMRDCGWGRLDLIWRLTPSDVYDARRARGELLAGHCSCLCHQSVCDASHAGLLSVTVCDRMMEAASGRKKKKSKQKMSFSKRHQYVETKITTFIRISKFDIGSQKLFRWLLRQQE